MKKSFKRLSLVAIAATLALSGAKAQDEIATFRTWAMTPPMGWNSWDCYYSSVTEKEVMQNAQYLVDHDLVRHGWEYVVIDIRWYCNHPSLGGGWYNQNGNQDYVLDEYGRYLPSPSRFPSCMVDGKNQGFKALADKLHAMGLKLGIHLMRGVPKVVVGSSYKLKGSEQTPWTQVYDGTTSPCGWLGDNLRVRDNSYGQLYYNSIMDLYAEWGVDFLKIDDLSRPFYTDEVQMIRRAIDQTGRPIVLSLSPGKTQYSCAEACLQNANMWRMMDDLWDNWSAVDAVFPEADFWSHYTRPGNYADCDMLPLGHIAATIADPGYTNADPGHWTQLSQNEQRTMMTPWGICHSPLFFGGEMTRNDDFTLSLLTNEEYHQMHKYGQDAHQVLADEDCGRVVWTSVDPATGNRYLALFQRDNTRWIVGQKALYRSETVAYTTDGHAVDVDIPWPEGSKTLVLVVDDGGDNFNYDQYIKIENNVLYGLEPYSSGVYVYLKYKDDPDIYASTTVMVMNYIKSISVRPGYENIVVELGDYMDLSEKIDEAFIFTPEDFNEDFNYECQDEDIVYFGGASFDPIKKGKTKVYAVVYDYSGDEPVVRLSASVNVEVVKTTPTHVESIVPSTTERIAVSVGDIINPYLIYTVLPEDADDKSVTLEIINPDIIKRYWPLDLNENGEIYAKYVGDAAVKIISNDNPEAFCLMYFAVTDEVDDVAITFPDEIEISKFADKLVEFSKTPSTAAIKSNYVYIDFEDSPHPFWGATATASLAAPTGLKWNFRGRYAGTYKYTVTYRNEKQKSEKGNDYGIVHIPAEYVFEDGWDWISEPMTHT